MSDITSNIFILAIFLIIKIYKKYSPKIFEYDFDALQYKISH
jgi:hypothetical protein